MNYKQCIDYYENIILSKEQYGLHPIKELLRRIGDPQNELKVIHIAGTNGKGSISNLLKNVLFEQGYNIGLYNSPYILTPRETIFNNHTQIPEATFVSLSNHIIKTCIQMAQDGMTHPSAFECLTALAFQYFLDIKVDFAIIEVGLGGLNDATNVFTSPLVSIISSIDYDHTQFLGNTLESIASAKAGIIKKEVPVVVAPNADSVISVINEKAKNLNAPIYSVNLQDIIITMYENNLSGMTFSIISPYFNYPLLTTMLIGEHQLINISVMLTSLHVLSLEGIKISDDAVKAGVSKTYWSCRCEYLKNPQPILIDGAHNASSMDSFTKVLETYCQKTPITFLFGALSDKDIDKMLEKMAAYSQTIILAEPLSPRSMPLSQLIQLAKKHFLQVISYESIDNALDFALEYAKKHSTLLCCVGSLYLAIPIRNKINKYVKN